MSNPFGRFLAVGFLSLPVLLALAITEGCGLFASQPPSQAEDLQFAQASSAGKVAFDNGDVELAAQLYQRALTRAHAMDDSLSIAQAAYNLAACEITLNRYDPAVNHLKEARYNREKNKANLDEIQLLIAKVDYLREQDAQSRSMSEPLCKSTLPMVRLQAQSLLVLIACDQGNLSDAKSKLGALNDTARQMPNVSPAVMADVEKAEGMVANLDRQMHVAAEHFDRETDLLRACHRYRDLIHSLSRSALAHAAAGEFGDAADRYYRAALACTALKDQARARDLAGKALVSARASGNAELTFLIERLIDENSATTAP